MSKYFKKLMVNYDLIPEKKFNSVFDRLIYLVKEKKEKIESKIRNFDDTENGKKEVSKLTKSGLIFENINEDGELFSIDFFHQFQVEGKEKRIVFETWRVTKKNIVIYVMDEESLKSMEYYLNPFRNFKYYKSDYKYSRFTNEIKYEKPYRDHMFSEPKSMGDEVFKIGDFEFRRCYNSSDTIESNILESQKFGEILIKEFNKESFFYKKSKSIFIDELNTFNIKEVSIPHEFHFPLNICRIFDYKSKDIWDGSYMSSGFLRFFNETFKFPLSQISIDIFLDDNNYLIDSFITERYEVGEKMRSDYENSLIKLKILIEKGYNDYLNYTDSGLKTKQKDFLVEYEKGEESLVIEHDIFYKILTKNQTKIKEIDREYIQKFVKLNNYLKVKYESLYNIFKKLKIEIEKRNKIDYFKNEEEINFFEGIVYSYNLMVNHSIVLVTSLVEDDMITFYETYEVFDKMNVFNTNWENEVNDQLSKINESLQDLNFSIRGLMNQMRSMERKIVNGLQSINTSIGSLENSINKQLSETNSRLKYENLTNYYKKSTLPGVMDWFDGPK